MRKSKIRSSRIRSVGDEIDFGEVEINNLIRDFMIREAFNMFDEDHSGDIDKREFSKLVATLGLEISEKKANEMMKEMDKDGSGSIDYDEFYIMMSKFQFGKESPIAQHLENTFNDYDKNMDNYITWEDFRKVSEELDDVPITKDEAQMFINFCKYFGREKGIPSTSEEKVTFDEFINLLINLKFLDESQELKKREQVSLSNPNISGYDATSNAEKSDKMSLFKKSEKESNFFEN